MHVTLQLLNESGDELGRMRLQTVAVAAPGVETTRPDLGAQMTQFNERLVLALAQEGMTPALDTVGVKIAVSRGLLVPVGDEALIPLPVRQLGSADRGGRAGQPSAPESNSAPNQTGARPDTWDDLFNLDGNALNGGDGPLSGQSFSSNRASGHQQNPVKDNDWDNWEQLEEDGEEEDDK